MEPIPKTISVTQAAKICGVGRTTVGYWIRIRKLPAVRVGRNYQVRLDDLVYFLRWAGKPLPDELFNDSAKPHFPFLQTCHEFFLTFPHEKGCPDCLVLNQKRYPCFQTKRSGVNRCPEKTCQKCRYYQEVIQPRIQFIHQIDPPACVLQDLFFWAGNKGWSAACGVSVSDLIGLGVEEVVHPDSLAEFVSLSKKLSLGASEGIDLPLKLKGREEMVKLRISRLNEPEGCWLVVG